MATKECTKCNQSKPANFDHFSADPRIKTGLRASCRECNKLRNKKWSYGISTEQYLKMFADQNGSCQICKRPQHEFKRALHIDHNHETGEIRGLLCPRCNTGLSYLENKEFVEKGYSYLNKKRIIN